MKLHLLTLFLLAATLATTFAEEPKPPISKDVALKAIALFRAEPGSEQGRGAAAIIIQFAEASPDVEVTVSKAILPWMGQNSGSKAESILLAAYVAGSTQSQLVSGKKVDDALAGAKLVNETYRKLQQADPALHIDAIEKLIELEKQGKLQETLESK